jgi:glutamine amidotransferase
VSFVAQGNVYGAQCHPEKSSTEGLALLRNFVEICATVHVAS